MTEASITATETRTTIGEVLEQESVLDQEVLAELLDPARYTGAAQPLIDRVLHRYRSV